MGGGYLSLWKTFQISSNKTFIQNPVDLHRNIYFFADVQHLIKLFRNHFLDQGYVLNNKHINKTCIEMLLSKSGEINITHKISSCHLDVKGPQHQKVKTAVQLISTSVSQALKFTGVKGIITDNWEETSELIKMLNEWFDLFNSKSMYGKQSRNNDFGVNAEIQINFLNTVTDVIENMRATGKKSKLPFQNGIIICNNSLIGLYNELKSKFHIEYIITSRINQ